MKLFVSLVMLACLVNPANPSQRIECHCQKLREGEPTMGNPPINMNGGRIKRIRGTVFYPGGTAMKEAIIEVFDNHTKARDENIESEELHEILRHKRRLACKTGDDGKFCFVGLPSGKYLLRIGSHNEGQFSGAYILVTLDPQGKQSSNKGLTVEFGMSI